MELMTKSNLAEFSGQIGSKGDWLKRIWESWGSLATFVATFLSSSLPLFSTTMSPSSVRNDGIKGVDTDALSHLGPNVGKPVRRYGFASLLIVAT